MEIGMKSVLYN